MEFENFAKSLVEKYSMIEPDFICQDRIIEKIIGILNKYPKEEVDIYYIAQEILYPVLGVKKNYTSHAMRLYYEPYYSTFEQICEDLSAFFQHFE